MTYGADPSEELPPQTTAVAHRNISLTKQLSDRHWYFLCFSSTAVNLYSSIYFPYKAKQLIFNQPIISFQHLILRSKTYFQSYMREEL